MRQMTINKVVNDNITVDHEVCCVIYAKVMSFNLVKSLWFKSHLDH